MTLASPCGTYLLTHGRAAPVTIEAVPNFPLASGVFWHDPEQAMLYYALAADQTPADLNADAWVAASDVLLNVNGATGQVFYGLTFAYGAWNQANTGDGYVDTQAAVFMCTPGTAFCNTALTSRSARSGATAGGGAGGVAEPRGNIRVSGGGAITFSNCEFQHLGAAYALSIMEGCQGPVVFNNTFNDLSGGFLKLGSVGTDAAGSDDPASWDAHASVTHNTAGDMAIEYDGAVGYFGGFLFSADVSHNSVSDAGYSGFSQVRGWWGGQVSAALA